MSLRCYGVGYQISQLRHWVAHGPRLCIVQLKVQMGSRGISRIATDGYQVARLDGKLVGLEAHFQRVAPSLALQLLFVLVDKALQVAVDAGIAVRMVHIDRIAKAMLIHRQFADIAIGNGKDLLALHITRLHVYSAMKMVWARFTEIACQHNLVVYWRTILNNSSSADRFGILTATCQHQYCKECKEYS